MSFHSVLGGWYSNRQKSNTTNVNFASNVNLNAWVITITCLMPYHATSYFSAAIVKRLNRKVDNLLVKVRAAYLLSRGKSYLMSLKLMVNIATQYKKTRFLFGETTKISVVLGYVSGSIGLSKRHVASNVNSLKETSKSKIGSRWQRALSWLASILFHVDAITSHQIRIKSKVTA